jgi:hypothetical protein
VGALDRDVLRAHLPRVLVVEHDIGAGLTRQRRRAVRRAVAGHDHLEALARIVERAQVGDLGGDHGRLLVGGDDQGDMGRLGGLGRRAPAPAQPPDPGEEQAISDLRVDEQPGAGPEGDLQRGHGRGFSRRRDS